MSRITRSLAALALAALAVGCVDAVGPGTSRGIPLEFSFVAPFGLSPEEDAAIAAAFGQVDEYLVNIVEATTSELIVDTIVPANAVLDAHVLDVRIPEAALGRTVTLTLVGYDTDVSPPRELYRSVTTTTLDGTVGGTVRVDLQVRYTGPGIRGTVRDANGNGVSGVVVELVRDNSTVETAITDVDGTYLFADPGVDLVDGTYMVRPAAPAASNVCPLSREVSVSGDVALLANFRVQTDVCGANVLVMSGGDFDDTDVVAGLFANNPLLDVETFFYVNTLPSLDLLAGYDVILVTMNGLFDESAALGDRIAEYVNLGGNVVVSSFYFQGRSDSGLGSVGWGALEGLDPFTARSGGATYDVVSLDPSSIITHPLTSGVTTLTSLLYSSGVEEKVGTGTTVVARWNDGAPLVGYRVLSAGQRIVGVSLFPGAGDTVTGDVFFLWNNAVSWAGEAGGPS